MHDVLSSTSGSRDAVPSTSGINTRHASSSLNIRINDSINNNCDDDIINSTSIDEQDFGTQNKEHLQSEFQVEIFESESYESLPDIHLTEKQDPTLTEQMEEETMVTTFTSISEYEDTNRRTGKKSKFEVRSSASDSE